MRVKQHGWVVMQDDGRLVRFVVFSTEEDQEHIPCFLCGDTCLTLQRGPNDAVTGWELNKPIHPTGDDQQHCTDCCSGCKINRKKDVVL